MHNINKFYIQLTQGVISVYERYVTYGLIQSQLLGYFDSEKEARRYVKQCNKQYGQYL